jgi:hypothetical protein
MDRVWITNASPTVQAVVDPVAAACEDGFIPTKVHLIENPGVDEEGDEAKAIIETIVEEYGESIEFDMEMIDHERDFEAIVDFYRHAVMDAPDDSEVAFDLTPGRKFMAVMAFQAARQYEADHIFYLYIHSAQYYGRSYPELPQTAVDLMDFTEVFQ